MKTYNRETFLAAQLAWAVGEFGPTWNAIRKLAAERGFLYPPSGTPHDDRDDANPSQRAIVWRALEDNPDGLRRIVRRSKSWHEVVEQVIVLEAAVRTYAAELDPPADPDLPTRSESVTVLRDILGRLAS